MGNEIQSRGSAECLKVKTVEEVKSVKVMSEELNTGKVLPSQHKQE